MPLGLTDAAIQKKIYGSGTTALIISNKEMEDIMKLVKSLKELELLVKGISETIKNERKEQKGAANLLGRVLAGKEVMRAGEGKIRADLDF